MTMGMQEGDLAFKLLYAKKSPYLAYFLVLERVSMALPCAGKSQAAFDKACASWRPHAFKVAPGYLYMGAQDLALAQEATEDIMVYENVAFTPDGMLCAVLDPVPLSQYLMFLPQKATTEQSF